MRRLRCFSLVPLRLLPLAVLAVALASCGDDGPVDAQREIDAGVASLKAFRFDLAEQSFARAATVTPPGSQQWRHLTLAHAVAWHHQGPVTRGNLAKATALYRSLIEQAGTSPEAARAHLNLARMADLLDFADDKVDPAAALIEYQAVIAGWPNDPIAGEAALRIMMQSIEKLDEASIRAGITYGETWLAAHPNEAFAGVMYQIMGQASHRPLNQLSKAIAYYRQALAADPLVVGKNYTLWWTIANLCERVGDNPGAIAAYREIVIHYPTSGKSWEAIQAIKRLGGDPPPQLLYDPTKLTLKNSATGTAP